MKRRCDHQRVFEANSLEDAASVRAERDRKDLVRGLGHDDGDGPIRRRAGGRGRNQQESGGEYEESAHATHTSRQSREVP
jgi:hypothetical protein